MSPLARFERHWLEPQPAERLGMLRVLIGGFALVYLLSRIAHFASYADFPAERFRPVGVVSLLAQPLAASTYLGVIVVAVLSGIAFVAGWRYLASGPLFAVSFLWVTTYRCSFGMIFHQDNLVAIHLLILATASAAHAFSWDARSLPSPAPDARYGWPIRAISWVTITSYVLAGVAKIQNGGLDWASGEVLKSHIAYDALRKLELGGTHSPIGAWLVQFSMIFWALGILTLVLELGAPFAALGGRIRNAWVCGIWSFHVGVIALMAIGFAYPVSGAAFASFFAVEDLVKWLSRARGAFRVESARPKRYP